MAYRSQSLRKKSPLPLTDLENGECVKSDEEAVINRSRGMSIQWGLPMLEQLLPDDLYRRLQSASVDPHYVFPEEGNQMPVYNAATGEHIKVSFFSNRFCYR